MAQDTPAPDSEILAGPILRRIEPGRLVLWLASRSPLEFRLHLALPEPVQLALAPGRHQHQVRVGSHCHLQLLDVSLDTPLPEDTAIPYDLQWRRGDSEDWVGIEA